MIMTCAGRLYLSMGPSFMQPVLESCQTLDLWQLQMILTVCPWADLVNL